jgi:hypothetical protein
MRPDGPGMASVLPGAPGGPWPSRRRDAERGHGVRPTGAQAPAARSQTPLSFRIKSPMLGAESSLKADP